jgi:lipopolysaccharide transport system ATP-binding protein
MTKVEIDRKFDEIVDFSGVEKFLDTPIKRYSSGMKVRLAFAVAAHLEPEILIIDEVLAVGDAAFQQKCVQRMKNVASMGASVLFVSHNIGAVRELCDSAIQLNQGRLTMHCAVDSVASAYVRDLEVASSQPLAKRDDRSGRGLIRVVDASVTGPELNDLCETGAPLNISLDLQSEQDEMVCVLCIFDEAGQPVLDLRSRPGTPYDMRTEAARVTCQLPDSPLVPGRYRLDYEIWSHGVMEDAMEGAAFFDVMAGSIDGRFVERKIRKASATARQIWTLPVS